MIVLTVNGQTRSAGDGDTVADLVAQLTGGRPPGIAVARNSEVVPRSRWSDCVLVEGDVLEILSATQGG